ncbi:MAG: TetR/AcrR family transcriptional regulator [Treponema sp.]|jgi:AcrR family transcriptional regulator|nr:TetR/AcrR family transcriptional regulator [Treponema sp.]
MTKTDIIRAAFRVWGRRLYQSTSLTELAQELQVTKPALYRHFKHKKALEQAMFDTFFDECATFLKPHYDKALASEDKREALFIMLRGNVDYFGHNPDMFLFSLIQVYGGYKRGEIPPNRFRSLGIDMEALKLCFDRDETTYPSVLQLVLATSTFWVARFHKDGLHGDECSSARLTYSTLSSGADKDALLGQLALFIEEKVAHGLGFDRERVEPLDYARLETLAQSGVITRLGDATVAERLLKAVASAVAEVGPWNVSMEMVARRAGLSKSGLYAHFKNRQDMLTRLFLTEFDRIVEYAEAAMRSSDVPVEKLYLAIASIADYLRSNSEILITLDWLRTRRIELRLTMPPSLYHIFSDFHFGEDTLTRTLFDEEPERVCVPQWILFLLVNTLMQRPDGIDFANVSNESIRVLFRFITCGIGGFHV